MSHIDHFSAGLLTPVTAYFVSCVGSMLGLLLTSRARGSRGASKARWLVGGALAIGGTGIWSMHFIAMMGFQVAGTPIRYDVPLTIASAAMAVLVVGAGLFLVSYHDDKIWALAGGGLLTGAGVVTMHYLGMAAMNMHALAHYDPVTVGLSVVIAIVAATAALWFTLRVRGALATAGAALIMGVAVTGMHYTGMMAISVEPMQSPGPLSGAEGIDFLLPLLVGVSVLALGLLLIVLLSPSERELASEAELMARLEGRLAGQAPTGERVANRNPQNPPNPMFHSRTPD